MPLQDANATPSFGDSAWASVSCWGPAVGLIVFMSVRDGVSRSPLYDERLVTELFQDASPAVVEIQVSRIPQAETFRSLFPNDTGSGFLVDRQGHVVTNYHVVDRAQTVKVTLSDGRTVDGAVVGPARSTTWRWSSWTPQIPRESSR